MERQSELVTVDVAAVLDQVSRRMRQEALIPEFSEASAVRMHSGRVHYWNVPSSSSLPLTADHLSQIAHRLQVLQSGLDSHVEAAIRNIGASPPSGADLRGRIGAAAIRILRRLFWWYSRSLHAFGDALAIHQQAEIEVLKSIVLTQMEMRREIDALRREVDHRIRAAG